MATLAAVMTGKGIAAIASVHLAGTNAKSILEKIFSPAAGARPVFETGRILLGDIIDGDEIIDQVVIGCEQKNRFAINCHGNPLILEMITELLARHGVSIVTAEKLIADTSPGSTIAKEAQFTQPRSRTITGVKTILNQVPGGLSRILRQWQKTIDSVELSTIVTTARQILENSQVADYLINGCKVVISGPPNSGKSTLLNCLCGREKAIVTDIPGTTRDWIGATCRTGTLVIEFFDTAGLDAELLSRGDIDKASQERAVELTAKADLVFFVLDTSEKSVPTPPSCEKILVVLNKTDLPVKLNRQQLTFDFTDLAEISAKTGKGIDKLLEKVQKALRVTDFDPHRATCFTDRQKTLMAKLAVAGDKQEIVTIITELLNGQISV